MAAVGTAGYLSLCSKAEEARSVVEHESFESRFSSPVAAELVRDVFSVLYALLNHKTMRAEDAGVSTGDVFDDAWFEGEGARRVAVSLDYLIEMAYGQRKASAVLASEFREGVQDLVHELWNFLDRHDLRRGGTVDAALHPARTQLEDLGRNELSRLLNEATNAVREIQEQKGIVNASSQVIQEEKGKAIASASAASDAAGATGQVALASHYEKLAVDERAAASLFRKLTTFLALVAGGVALGFVLGPGAGMTWLDIARDDYVHLIQRTLLVGGVLGLAGYFARQAHQHRSMANWAGSLAVQLKTFESYVSPIDDIGVRNELRKSFAARAFGDHPAMKGEPNVAPNAAAIETLAGWVAKINGAGK